MDFIHAIDLNNFITCHNLKLNGCLSTPNLLALADKGVGEMHQSIDKTSIEQLSRGYIKPGAVTPRAIGEVVRGGILRSGQDILNGFDQVEQMSKETRRDAIACSDAELFFESVRREVAPDSPSRLSCLFLAERTDSGLKMLQSMFGKDRYILNVEIIIQLKMSRVDSAWFDDYFHSKNEDNAVNYWLGKQMNDEECWEYLFDGAFKVADQEQLEYIKTHGRLMP